MEGSDLIKTRPISEWAYYSDQSLSHHAESEAHSIFEKYVIHCFKYVWKAF